MLRRVYMFSWMVVGLICFLTSLAYAEPALYEIYNTLYGTSLTSNAQLESAYGVANDEVLLETNGYVMASARYAGYTQQFGYYTGLCTGAGQVELFNVTTTGYLYRCSDTGNPCLVDADCPAGTCDPLYDAVFLVGGGTSTIGFYDDPSGSPTWFSQPDLNSDGMDHMKTYRAADFDPDYPEYLIGWEDLPASSWDADYQDLVLIINYLSPQSVECCEVDDDCEDGVGCTDDACVAHLCQYTPNNANCNDGVGCTDDVCDPILGCQFTPNDANCNDGVGCTVDTCDEADDCQYTPSDALCDDGQFCNGLETCDPIADCQAGTNPCLPPYLCDEDGDQCIMADVILEPGDVYYNPNQSGGVTVKKPVCLDNQNDLVGGIQFDLCEYAMDGVTPVDCMECIDCELTERTTTFDCVVLELPNGCCRVILFCKNPGCAINPGLCDIVTVVYQTLPASTECPGTDCELQVPENIIVSDYDGYALAAVGLPGTVCPFACGDVCPADNPLIPGWDCGDGKVDIFDILCEVDFALTLTTPDECQEVRADVPTGTPPNCVDPDGSYNILDIMVLIDMVLNRQDCCTFYYTGVMY